MHTMDGDAVVPHRHNAVPMFSEQKNHWIYVCTCGKRQDIPDVSGTDHDRMSNAIAVAREHEAHPNG